nr:single-stranded DNA-binding protein [Victivallales bacterium]
MPSVNKVFLMGNLTRTPELRYTPSGAAICEFGMAINRTYVSNNVKKEEVTFIDVNVWQRQGELCQRRLQK